MLPKTTQPIYELQLISDPKTTITYRPYTVKEDRLALMAAESQDVKEMANVTRQIVNNCVLDEGFDCLNLPVFDVDWIYMHIRAKAVGEKITNEYNCQNILPEDGKPCNNKMKVTLNLYDVQVQNPKKDSMTVQLAPDLGVIMKYPTYKTTLSILDTDSATEQTLKTLYGSIDKIFDKDQMYPIRDESFESFSEWIDGLTTEQYNKITNWLETLPEIKANISHTCEKCGFIHEFNYEDPVNFF